VKLAPELSNERLEGVVLVWLPDDFSSNDVLAAVAAVKLEVERSNTRSTEEVALKLSDDLSMTFLLS
jgi:hypothetical protein